MRGRIERGSGQSSELFRQMGHMPPVSELLITTCERGPLGTEGFIRNVHRADRRPVAGHEHLRGAAREEGAECRMYVGCPDRSPSVWDWQRLGACRGRDSAQFFHPDGERGSSRLRREMRGQGGLPRLPGPRRVRRARARRPGAVRRLGRLQRDRAAPAARRSAGRTWPTAASAGSTSAGWRRASAGRTTPPCRTTQSPDRHAPRRAPVPGAASSRWRRPRGRAVASSQVPPTGPCRSATRRSLDGDLDVCQPVAPSGAAGAALLRSGSRRPLSVARTWSVCSPGVASHRQRPLPPGVRPRRTGASVASCQGPPSTRTSTLEMPRCCAQATPATITGPARGRLRRRAGVSMRDSRLDRPLRGPAARHPVRVELGERGQLQLGHPLVADTYPYRPGTTIRTGKPCSIGSGSPFMPTASIASRPSSSTAVGRAGGEPVDRAADHLVRAGVRAGLVEQVLQRYAEPARVADQVAADLVGDAGQRDVPLDHRPGEQFVERQRDRLVDQAVDPQRPGGRVDLRHHQRGVDPVELAVRRDVRRELGTTGPLRPAPAGRARPGRAGDGVAGADAAPAPASARPAGHRAAPVAPRAGRNRRRDSASRCRTGCRPPGLRRAGERGDRRRARAGPRVGRVGPAGPECRPAQRAGHDAHSGARRVRPDQRRAARRPRPRRAGSARRRTPITPNTAMPAKPSTSRRTASTPISAANAASSTTSRPAARSCRACRRRRWRTP